MYCKMFETQFQIILLFKTCLWQFWTFWVSETCLWQDSLYRFIPWYIPPLVWNCWPCFELIKDTPYLTLLSELWGAYHKCIIAILQKNYLIIHFKFNGIALYLVPLFFVSFRFCFIYIPEPFTENWSARKIALSFTVNPYDGVSSNFLSDQFTVFLHNKANIKVPCYHMARVVITAFNQKFIKSDDFICV